MAEDVVPGLLEAIVYDFEKLFEENPKIKALYAKVNAGAATYVEAHEFAIETGEALAKAFARNLSSDVLPDGKMYYNIAERIVSPMLENNHELVAEISVQIQAALNEQAGIGIKAIRPELNQDRIEGLVRKVSSAEQYDDVAWVLAEPVVNFTQSVVDASVRANADFQYKAGLRPRIIRRAEGKCCEWCSKLAGIYEYGDVKNTGNDVFRRHEHCRCTVDYHPGEGKRVQDVWSKTWHSDADNDKIEARKRVGLLAEDDAVQRNIRENIIPNQKIDTIVKRQQIHRVGTPMYEQRKLALQGKNQHGPSYLTISDDEILELVKKHSGKGEVKCSKNGQWDNKEIIVTNEKIIGVVVNNLTGKAVPTSVFKIHYAEEGVHIVPDYPSKKR